MYNPLSMDAAIADNSKQLDFWPKDETPPDQLDVPMIELTHRDPDGYIAIMRKPPGEDKLKPIYSIRVRELRTMLPELIDQLLQDGYATVNCMKAPRKRKGRTIYRTKDLVKTLQACYSDLDYYKTEQLDTFKKAYAVLHMMVANEWVPWPSIVARSGRGMYVFWLFEKPVEYNKNQDELYRQTQGRLNTILSRLGADPRAKDATRVLRIPGSYHTEAKARVHYTANYNGDGELVTYTLDALADSLNKPIIEPAAVEKKRLLPTGPRQLPEIKPAKAGQPLDAGSLMPKHLPKADSPEKYPARRRIFDLIKIAESRGGIAPDYRHFFLWRYACCLSGLGIYAKDLFDRVWQINRTACKPPQTAAEIHAACHKAYRLIFANGKVRGIRGSTIADELGVTAEEAQRLELTAILPRVERERRESERRGRVQANKESQRDKKRKLRRIYQECKGRGFRLPGRRTLANELDVDGQTVSIWLRSMGLTTNRRGRPKRL